MDLEGQDLQESSVALEISCEGSDLRAVEDLASAVVVDVTDTVHANVMDHVRDWEADLYVRVVDRDSKVDSTL